VNDLSSCAELRGLAVSFFGRQVLKGVDVRFPARRISVILGRSGSGKSTLLRSINRLNECFEGYEEEGEVRVLLGGAMALVLEGSPSAGTALTGSGEVYLDAGAASALYSLSADAPLSECSITGPTGQAVTTEQPAGAGDLPSYVSFTPPATGRYTVSCPTGTAVVVGPAMRMDRILPASLMILAALGSGVAGLVVGAAGLARVLRRD